MRFVICYDITDDHRRNRLATILLNYGKRIQESVFIADLDSELVTRMRSEVSRAIDANLDTVHIFALCRHCEERIEVLGVGAVPTAQAYYVI